MCLAIPGRIVKIEGDEAVIDYGGVLKRASLMVLPDAKVGDMVIVHAGFAIAKVDEDEARKTLEAYEQLGQAIAEEKSGGNSENG